MQLDECYRNLDITHRKTIRERGDMQVTCHKFMRFMSELKFYDMHHSQKIRMLSEKINQIVEVEKICLAIDLSYQNYQ